MSLVAFCLCCQTKCHPCSLSILTGAFSEQEIDFSAGTVGFWYSTGGDDLVQVVAPIAASTSSNGEDWHLGVLELPRDGYADTDENLYFSGVYVESGSITTSVSGPDGKLATSCFFCIL